MMVNFYKFRLLPEYTVMQQPRPYSPTASNVVTWNQPQYEIQPNKFDEEEKGDNGYRHDSLQRD
jgi:hypothetical protein